MDIDISRLKNLINKLSEPAVLVIGDLALDEMVYGETERISREAPVLILRHTNTDYILGAASNAAHNAVSVTGGGKLGGGCACGVSKGKVGVIGIAGEDYQAENLKNAFREVGIDCSSLVSDKNIKTITKTRISGSCPHSITQQIVRIDRQTDHPVSEETEEKLLDEIKRLVPLYDAVIISDYHIGTLTDKVLKTVTDTAKIHNKIVTVDAQKNLDKYKNITSMTPNLPDTQKHTGFYLKSKEDFLRAGNILLEQSGAESVVITCGSDGMAVIEKGNRCTHIPVFNKAEVFDVTGAGDTVTAVYTLALAAGAEPVYAALIGNIAAGITIKQYGCAVTNIDEILAAVPERIVLRN